jgi:UDP-glucose 4-epimerase
LKTILITGGWGYVGGRLVQALSQMHLCLVSTRSVKKIPAGCNAANIKQVIHTDLLSESTFPNEVDVVIHLAAINEVDCLMDGTHAIEVNINQTRIVLENAIAKKVKRFIYFSTAHVYGAPLQGEINESLLPRPIHPYAITHKAAEDYIVAAHQQGKIRSTVLRLSNSFGAPLTADVNRWTLLVNDLCKQVIEQKAIRLQSNGCQYRDFICLSDVVNSVYKMIEDEMCISGIVYNLGSGKSLTVLKMAEAIQASAKASLGYEVAINLPPNSIATKEPSLTYSIEKLQAEGIVVRTDIQNELKKMLEFCQANFKLKAG